jgi:hypothetical protein
MLASGWPIWQACAVLAAFVAVLVVALRTLTPELRRTVLWLATGAVLTLVPSLSSAPKTPLLIAPLVGGAVTIATIMCVAIRGLLPGTPAAQRPHVVARPLLVVATLALAWGHFVWGPRKVQSDREFIAMAGQLFEMSMPHLAPGSTDVIVLGPPPPGPAGFTVTAVAPYVSLLHPEVGLQHWRVLSVAPGAHTIEVLDDHVLVLTVPPSPVPIDAELYYRLPEHSLAVGDMIALDDVRAEVLAVANGSPTKVRFTFRRAFTDPKLTFMGWKDGVLQPLPRPEIKSTLTLAPMEMGPPGQ